MRHFRLINDQGYESAEEKAQLHSRLAEGKFDLDRDNPNPEAAICLCSHGSDECWHCGRGSKP